MNGRHRSLTALPVNNNCTNLALLKNNFAFYFISASAMSIIKLALKIFLSNVDAKDQKFEVMINSQPLTLK